MNAILGTHTGSDDTDTGWLIDEDMAACDSPNDDASALPWRILIVDDDVDVHVVTKFSLSNTCFQGRRLSFLHAYSGAEAMASLRDNADIAIVLLDVIMETNNAGLQVARQIREDLDNQLVRIILRTGQPGQALEHSIIVDYDINDFWCKTDLTTRKLFTTVISSLRTFDSLRQSEQRMASLTAALRHTRQQHQLELTLHADGAIANASGGFSDLLRWPALAGQQLSTLLSPYDAPHPLLLALAGGKAWAGELQLQGSDGVTHGLKVLLNAAQPPQAGASGNTALLSAAF